MIADQVWRFAPSPNGCLHIGHAYSALLNQNQARLNSGRFLLRIDNIDAQRQKENYENAIYEDLLWLGVEWRGLVYRQLDHVESYLDALERLNELGVLYPCCCTRSDIIKFVGASDNWPNDPDGQPHYPGICRHQPLSDVRQTIENTNFAIRLNIKKAMALINRDLFWDEHRVGRVVAHPERWGDIVLARKDSPGSYHLCVVIDDASQNVSNVVRGQDLYHATSLHCVLQNLLALPTPNYYHHKILRDLTGAKLSKSLNSKSIRAYRDMGMSAATIRHLIGFD